MIVALHCAVGCEFDSHAGQIWRMLLLIGNHSGTSLHGHQRNEGPLVAFIAKSFRDPSAVPKNPVIRINYYELGYILYFVVYNQSQSNKSISGFIKLSKERVKVVRSFHKCVDKAIAAVASPLPNEFYSTIHTDRKPYI